MTRVEPWEVWFADLEPSVGHEQGGRRPVVVVASKFRIQFPSRTTLVVPVTTRNRNLSHHVSITSVESGLDQPSWARTEDVKSISLERLLANRPIGKLAQQEMESVRMWISEMFDLGMD